MTHKRFTYPDYGTPSNFPELVQRSGSLVTVLSPVRTDTGLLFLVRFEDGYVTEAYDDELTNA